MGAESSFSKHFAEFGGIDYRSSDATRKPRFARDSLNVEHLKNNSISVRRGQKVKSGSFGGAGTVNYVRNNNGVTQEEAIRISDDLYREKNGIVTIAYLGAGDNVVLKILPNEDAGAYQYLLTITIDDVLYYSLNIGSGIDNDPSMTVDFVVNEIDNLFPVFACSLAGADGDVPAACLAHTIVSFDSSVDPEIPFSYPQIVYCPTTTPFADFFAEVNDSDFVNASLTNTGNRLFIGTKHNQLYKYDGLQTFRAGMPCAGRDTSIVAAISAATTGTGITGDYSWFVTYEQVDALGISIEGDESNIVDLTLANQSGRVTIPTIQTSSGFLTSFAKANNGGTETGTTLTVDDGAGGGHTLQVGQTAYFRDNAGNEVEDVVTAISEFGVTFANSYTIANNATISANLKINLWRNKNGGDAMYLVRTFANDPSVTNFTYDDATADSSLAIEYVYPVAGHGLPPANMKYLTVFQQLLIGSLGSDDNVHYSDLDDPEYFAYGASSFTVRSKSNNPVTGVGSNQQILLIQKTNETAVIQGDLTEGNFRQEILADAVGTDSHHSIIDVDGTLWFYSKNLGIRRIVGNQLPDDVSYRILPVITGESQAQNPNITHSKVVAINDKDRQQAIFFLPIEEDGIIQDESFCLVADYRSQFEVETEYDEQGRGINQIPKIRWWVWDNMNLAGGAAIFEDELVYTQRRYSTTLAAYEYLLTTRLSYGDQYDFVDFAAPYNWSYEASWIDGGEPDILKKFIRLILYSFPEGFSASFTVTATLELNYQNGTTRSRKDILFGTGSATAGWGSWAWGEVPWGDVSSNKKKFDFKPNVATSAKLIYERQIWCEQVVISAWSLEVVPAFRPKDSKT